MIEVGAKHVMSYHIMPLRGEYHELKTSIREYQFQYRIYIQWHSFLPLRECGILGMALLVDDRTLAVLRVHSPGQLGQLVNSVHILVQITSVQTPNRYIHR